VSKNDKDPEVPKGAGPEPKIPIKPSKPEAVEESVNIGPVQQHAMPLGPSLPPAEDSYILESEDSSQAPGSPYSAGRALIRDLTLPAVPNTEIPPSPPGSPPPALNQKFEQFLELKKKGVHFNNKLSQSSALKNPSLMDKLMKFVEIDERSQYATTLSPDLWNPSELPDWAFRGQLKQSQGQIKKEREAQRAAGGRTTIDFVSSSTSDKEVRQSGAAGLSSSTKPKKGGW
jgi:hypothetical protein